ncbi:TatD family hydrolase [Anaeromicropila herbilytica]|uniref:Deoxyribonuclease n=1 Tax=Anaeromicropila herbilytica TaxID=2785025 RepID=A0A7R7EHW3_9FIRM|nr:TatD family hydrolase [Anaeromicropila herbilytica]BCN28742.1 deoxyribonuclease [Anaeromicropila herbilytica]
MIIDTHAHYDDEQFDKDRDELLHNLKENDIEYVVNIGASLKTTKNTLELMEAYDFVYGAIGVHPSETAELNEENFAWLKEQVGREKVVAIGEIGLDYYWDEPDREIQKKWFHRQMELAKETKLPMVIHSRDAAKDTLDMMKTAKADQVGGVIHCFSYGVEMAREYLNMGFYLGIGGVLTFNNAKKLKEVVEYIPLDRIVLETDCPYLSPVPNRGKRNSSLNLVYVIDEIARLKRMNKEEIIRATNKNAKELYRIR